MSPNFNTKVSLEDMWRELRSAYDMTFVEELMRLPSARVYAFGGTVRDILANKPWKDLDLRITLPGPKEERNPIVEEIVRRHGDVILKLFFSDGECFVLRSRFPGKKQMVADIQVVESLEATPGDFTISSLLIDLATGELHQQSSTGFDDFQKKLVRPMAGANVFTAEYPSVILRALKVACHTGFDLEPQFEKLIRTRPERVTEHIEQDLPYIQKNGKDSYAETKLGNIFSGLKTDPQRYVSFINELGLYASLCQGFASVVPNRKTTLSPVGFDVHKYRKELALEEKISLFLSDISRSMSNQPGDCFEALKKALALDTIRADGNEFVVNPTKIVFVP